eukprot:TRINITY_DN3469_c0_g1_i15.p2 TRINITY_DN3469_c0_g1~~TRINITY_DN3469_c0_g1_i15.p2  ORF type:complete len:150 (-),score=15.90 TRINITY_DN3469_c0_g1_i15:213-662(-)
MNLKKAVLYPFLNSVKVEANYDSALKIDTSLHLSRGHNILLTNFLWTKKSSTISATYCYTLQNLLLAFQLKNIVLDSMIRAPKAVAGELVWNLNKGDAIGLSGEFSLQKKELQGLFGYRKRLLTNLVAQVLVRSAETQKIGEEQRSACG